MPRTAVRGRLRRALLRIPALAVQLDRLPPHAIPHHIDKLVLNLALSLRQYKILPTQYLPADKHMPGAAVTAPWRLLPQTHCSYCPLEWTPGALHISVAPARLRTSHARLKLSVCAPARCRARCTKP